MYKKLFSIILVAAILLVALVPAAFAATRDGEPDEPGMVGNGYGRDDRSHPLGDKQRGMLQKAVELKMNGAETGSVMEVTPGHFVELEREGEDAIWTVLGDFSDFFHNSIPEPDRDYDNTTIWVPDFNADHYANMLFGEGEGVNSMREYYIEQSSNRYTVYGDIAGWITVPGNAYDYDDGAPTGQSCGPCVWSFIDDSVDGWYEQQLNAGMEPDDINGYLEQYDVWDRYDYDGDGDFDEPDGYIDRFQSVHAGEGNEAGGGALGDHAIWSHSWYAYYNLIGTDGPEFNPSGGLQIGDSDYWIGKYVINPENGGVGVFAHEYGHDLGLPDLYDYTGENSTGFWTLMSSGSWLSDGTVDIGSKPSHMGAWEKLQLGWLNHEVVDSVAANESPYVLGPMEYNSTKLQGLVVNLPDKYFTAYIGAPYEDDYLYYSGSGDDLDNFMYKSFELDAGSSLTAMVNYDIEVDWDYAYLVASIDGGATWESVETSQSVTTDPNAQNFGFGITGASGGWVELTADLSAFTGEMLLGFRYWTDGNTVNPGLMVDNLEVTGYPVDGAEADAGWTMDGFIRSQEYYESGPHFNAYVAEFRQYTGYDTVLQTAYNFYWTGSYPYFNWVTHYPYQDGLLINYWDTSFPNNNVGSNCAAGRCGGLLLPVDAHPEALYQKGGVPGSAGGVLWRNRVQTYDSTFGLEVTDQITLYWRDSKLSEHFVRGEIGPLPANPTFCDYESYYDPANPMGSVIVPETGTQIQVNGVSDYTEDGAYMAVSVSECEPLE